MKAFRRTISPGSAIGAALLLLLGACVAPAPAPVPMPPPAQPLPPPPRQTAAADWHDNPATPGSWQWRREGSLSIASFGDSPMPALLSMTCDSLTQTMTVSRGTAPVAVPAMTISTTSLTRTLAIRPGAGGSMAAAVAVTLAGRDPLLDAMAYSRGRFAVEVPGLAPLYLPSWPEVSRVIEDCR